MTTPVFNPANFAPGQPIDNNELPYLPGTTLVYDTFTAGNVLEQIITVTVTEKPLKIDGVNCTVVSDIVTDAQTGQLIEKTQDYFAQDKSGNVWYFGEAAQQYENGKLVGKEGSWKAGVHGAQPGIVMETSPQVGDSYDQENAPGVAQDHAEVTKLTGSASVPFGTFHHTLLVTLETSVLEPGAAETKYYAAGVGEVFGRDLVTGEQDRLVSVTTAAADSKTLSSALTDGGVISQFVQAMAAFGANDSGVRSGNATLPPNDSGQQGVSQLLQAMTAFGASGPGVYSYSSNATLLPHESGQHHFLAVHAHHG